MGKKPYIVRTVDNAHDVCNRHWQELQKSGMRRKVSRAYYLWEAGYVGAAERYIRAVREFAATLYPLQEELPV